MISLFFKHDLIILKAQNQGIKDKFLSGTHTVMKVRTCDDTEYNIFYCYIRAYIAPELWIFGNQILILERTIMSWVNRKSFEILNEQTELLFWNIQRMEEIPEILDILHDGQKCSLLFPYFIALFLVSHHFFVPQYI